MNSSLDALALRGRRLLLLAAVVPDGRDNVVHLDAFLVQAADQVDVEHLLNVLEGLVRAVQVERERAVQVVDPDAHVALVKALDVHGAAQPELLDAAALSELCRDHLDEGARVPMAAARVDEVHLMEAAAPTDVALVCHLHSASQVEGPQGLVPVLDDARALLEELRLLSLPVGLHTVICVNLTLVVEVEVRLEEVVERPKELDSDRHGGVLEMQFVLVWVDCDLLEAVFRDRASN